MTRPRPLPDEFNRLTAAIENLIAGRKRLPLVGGQQLGQESYSLRYSGAQQGEVNERLLDLRNALSADSKPQPPLRSGEPYTDEEDALVLEMSVRSCTLTEMASTLQRTEVGVQARVERLGLLVTQSPSQR